MDKNRNVRGWSKINLVTFSLYIHRSEIWFVQFILDSSDNLCTIDRMEMDGNFGQLNIHCMDKQKNDLIYMLDKLKESCWFSYECV